MSWDRRFWPASLSTGELAVLLRPSLAHISQQVFAGTLARVPPEGGAAREIIEDIEGADWSKSASALAVAR